MENKKTKAKSYYQANKEKLQKKRVSVTEIFQKMKKLKKKRSYANN